MTARKLSAPATTTCGFGGVRYRIALDWGEFEMMGRLGLLAFVFVAMSGSAQAEAWTCSAKNIVSGNYAGGDTAYIHLSPYERGNNYPVTKKGKTVTGRTSNGTPFVCKQQ
ncbi:hypothetical protein RAD15_04570 [Bradyrhizobium sp. 14AA]